MNENTGVMYSSFDEAHRLDPHPEQIVAVPKAMARLPRRARPIAYRAGGAAAKLLRGQNNRASWRG